MFMDESHSAASVLRCCCCFVPPQRSELFWLTNTGVSASRLYWENKLGFFTPRGVKVPAAASAFPDDLY
jgi:hypothetical protein